ncbi:MAG: EamA family transporter [Treponema sp.]|nr:EamA family transporter [Treponema sp.]
MFNYIWPVALIVLSNIVYQICAKGIPQEMNTFASMTVTYAVATLVSGILFFISTKGSGIIQQFKLTNWATVVLGIVITGLEVGFIFAYKAGWKVNTLATVTNAFLAIALLFLGFFMYKESINWSKVVGVIICLVGLWFIKK